MSVATKPNDRQPDCPFESEIKANTEFREEFNGDANRQVDSLGQHRKEINALKHTVFRAKVIVAAVGIGCLIVFGIGVVSLPGVIRHAARKEAEEIAKDEAKRYAETQLPKDVEAELRKRVLLLERIEKLAAAAEMDAAAATLARRVAEKDTAAIAKQLAGIANSELTLQKLTVSGGVTIDGKLTVGKEVQVGLGPKGKLQLLPSAMRVFDDKGINRIAIVVETPGISGGESNRSFLSLMDTNRDHTVFAQATEAGEHSTSEFRLTANSKAPAAYSLQAQAADPSGPSGDMLRRFVFGKEGRITFTNGPNGGSLKAESTGGPKWVLP